MHARKESPGEPACSPGVVSIHGANGRSPAVVTQSFPAGGARITELAVPPTSTTGPHAHERARVVVVLEGGFVEENASGSHLLEPGDVLLRGPRLVHATRFGERPTRLVVFEYPSVWPGGEAEVFVQVPSVECFSLVARTGLEIGRTDSYRRTVLEGLGLALLGSALRRRGRAATSGAEPRIVREAKSTIRSRFREAIALGVVAADLRVAPSHLARTFRESEGMSLGDYLRRVRTVEAYWRIIGTEEPFAEIARTCGFHDHSHMSRSMRSALGTSPNRLRKEHAAPPAGG